jgi:flagellar assembly protein FliH
MAARILGTGARQVSPVVWKEKRPVECKRTDPRRDQPKLSVDESQLLRTRMEELKAASELETRKAYEAGRQAGEAAARQAFEREVRANTEKLAEAIASLGAARADAVRRAEADTVQLAIEIARRVLHRELSVDSSAIGALVKAALEKLQGQEIHRVKVHPDQATVVRACLEQAGRSRAIEIIADPGQQRGGALFELNRGSLDASVETQLREIERGLADELEARR